TQLELAGVRIKALEDDNKKLIEEIKALKESMHKESMEKKALELSYIDYQKSVAEEKLQEFKRTRHNLKVIHQVDEGFKFSNIMKVFQSPKVYYFKLLFLLI